MNRRNILKALAALPIMGPMFASRSRQEPPYSIIDFIHEPLPHPVAPRKRSPRRGEDSGSCDRGSMIRQGPLGPIRSDSHV